MQERILKQIMNNPIYLTSSEMYSFLDSIRIYTNETKTQYISLVDYLTYDIADKVITILRGE